MKPSVEQIQSLLTLKRHEAPEEGYLEDFLVEFHRRRRQDVERVDGPVAAWQAFKTWFSELGGVKWAYAGGLAYATGLAVVLTLPVDKTESQPTPVPVRNEVVPAKDAELQQLDALDLRPTAQGHKGEQEF